MEPKSAPIGAAPSFPVIKLLRVFWLDVNDKDSFNACSKTGSGKIFSSCSSACLRVYNSVNYVDCFRTNSVQSILSSPFCYIIWRLGISVSC